MAFPQNHRAEAFAQYENFNDWVCPTCFKTISASRPPIFNADNCSCDDIAAYHGRANNYYPEPAAHEHQFYNPDIAAPVYNQAHSINSSTATVPSPEGPENETPDLQIGNAYLPLAAPPGLNETQHQRAASFHSDMSYPLRRFLGEMHSQPAVYATEHILACPSTSTSAFNLNFLSQEIHLQCSKKAKKGSPYSKLSWVSESSGHNGDVLVSNWGSEGLIGTGGWAGHSGFADANAYKMVLSGMSDAAVFDDDDHTR